MVNFRSADGVATSRRVFRNRLRPECGRNEVSVDAGQGRTGVPNGSAFRFGGVGSFVHCICQGNELARHYVRTLYSTAPVPRRRVEPQLILSDRPAGPRLVSGHRVRAHLRGPPLPLDPAQQERTLLDPQDHRLALR
jgi:hypothetical protein